MTFIPSRSSSIYSVSPLISSSPWSTTSLSSFLFGSKQQKHHQRRRVENRLNSKATMWVLTTFLLISQGLGVDGSNNEKDLHSQRFRIFQAMVACNMTITMLAKPDDGGLYCEPLWDNVMCWPTYTPAGKLVQQSCAGYIDGFNSREKAHRYCMPDGTWAIHPDVNITTSWTNFMDCTKKKEVSTIDPVIAHHMPNITLISTVGYSISLAFLLVATVLMVGLKKLHCQRNTIHINLFLSFIFRAVVSLVKNGALDKGFAFSWDFDYASDGALIFKEEKPHWECKLLNILHHYALGANYTWIFVEGLYLHTLIFFAVFSQTKRYFKLYIVIGWTFPLIFVIIWIFLRFYKNNVLCWNTHEKNYYWILEAPIIASITINFFFFLNIIRVLFTKIRNCNTRDPRRFRKLAKSTLVLIPLFGVYYIIFIVLARHRHPDIAVVHMYLEMTLNSFQGIVVALLFCFFNGEVRAEISKRWNRHWLKRRYSTTSGRSSRAFSTSSFTLRERFSLSNIGSPSTHDNNDQQKHPSNKRTALDITANHKITTDSEKNSLQTIPRVPSESKVTFNFAESNNGHHHNNGSSLPDTSLPDVVIKNKEPTPTSDEDTINGNYLPINDKDFSGELDQLLPVKPMENNCDIIQTLRPRNSPTLNGGSKNELDDEVIRKPLNGLRNSSFSSAPFPSSKGLSLVRGPVQ